MNQSHEEAATCRTAVFERPGSPLHLQQHRIPTPNVGELLLKVSACTICGSDLHTINGNRDEKTPTILGHEIIGHVISQGSESINDLNGTPIRNGDRVTWAICMSCGECSRCRSDLPQKCTTLRKYGHEVFDGESGFVGGFAEYILLPSTSSLLRLTNDIADEVLCPANCATATVVAACREVPEFHQRNVLIIGGGMLGLTATAYTKSLGAREITVIEPDKQRRKLAPDFGATQVIENTSVLGERFDVLLDFSGVSEAIEQSIPHTQIGGTVVLVGSVTPSPMLSIDPEFLVRNLIRLVGVHNYHPKDLHTAVEFLITNSEQYPFKQLVSRSYSLENINSAVDYALREKPIRVMIKP
ncbi:MAG: alcohol dehydrogenase [Planctomycetaceae bacterium]|nr:alcohol dehydrogenase [Planctomycetaceae bacterium]|tara:strand:+ start:1609 stop:2679 length:1071 start_codon:yes stop_codon:yes gene_type:complete